MNSYYLFPFCIFLNFFLKNKKHVSKRTLRRVVITRGTTKIADIKICRSSKSVNFYALTQHSREASTGCLNLSGFRLRSDKKSAVLYRDRTIPGSLVNSLQVPSSSTPLNFIIKFFIYYTLVFFICQEFF